jgi:hypothetical protein
VDPPGEQHWQGGTNTTCMSHIAMLAGTDDGTTCLEPVTDRQHAARLLNVLVDIAALSKTITIRLPATRLRYQAAWASKSASSSAGSTPRASRNTQPPPAATT